MARLAGDPALRARLGANGEQKVRTRFDHRATIGALGNAAIRRGWQLTGKSLNERAGRPLSCTAFARHRPCFPRDARGARPCPGRGESASRLGRHAAAVDRSVRLRDDFPHAGAFAKRAFSLLWSMPMEAHSPKPTKSARRDELLALFHALRPDAVITEAFPFGRRQMRFELVPLMQAARAAPWKPLTVASIRDIMQEGRADNRVAESLRYFEDWYDVLLVHGDPQLIRIEETLQGAEAILPKVRYTGLVTPDAAGHVGSALDCRRRGRFRRWRRGWPCADRSGDWRKPPQQGLSGQLADGRWLRAAASRFRGAEGKSGRGNGGGRVSCRTWRG